MNYECAVSSDKTLVIKISEIFLPQGMSYYDKMDPRADIINQQVWLQYLFGLYTLFLLHLGEDVFAEEKPAEDIFTEFVFVKLHENLAIKFRKFFLLGFSREKKSNFS